MKRIKINIPLNVLVAVIFIFSMCLWGQEKPTDEELEQLLAAKTAQILLEEDYGSAKDIKLPLQETLEKLLLPAGFKLVESGAEIILQVKLRGRAVSRYYSRTGSRISAGGQTGYTGASISGTVYLKKGERWFFKESFSGSVSPSTSIHKGAYRTPSSAPFKNAFSKSSLKKQVIKILSGINKNRNALLALYLKSDDWRTRQEAAILLGDADASDGAVVSSLVAALGDKSSTVQVEVVKSLGKLKEPNSIEPLLNQLLYPNASVREAVIKALDNIDPGWRESAACKNLIPSFLSAFKSEKPGIRQGTAEIFGEIYYQPALKPLIAVLIDKYSAVRREAVQSLDKKYPDWRTGPEAAELVPDFIAGLKSTSDDTRKGAISALEELGDARALGPLIDALKDTQISIREAALKSLEKKYQDWGSSEEAGKQVPFFINELKSKSVKHRKHAARVLAAVNDPGCVPALIETLKDKDKNVIRASIDALGGLSDPAAAPSLIDLLENKDFNIKLAAVTALGKLNTPNSIEVEALSRALADNNSTIRERAVKALGNKKDDRVIEPLITALKDKSSNVTKAAIDALGEREDPRAVMPLVDFLKRSKPHHKKYVINVRASAFQALEKMDDLLIVDPMVELLKEKDLDLRIGVEKRLENIKDPRAADILIGYLKSEHIETRATVRRILGKLKNERAVEPLIEILKSPDKRERKGAASALKSITGEDYGEKYKKWKKWWDKNKK